MAKYRTDEEEEDYFTHVIPTLVPSSEELQCGLCAAHILVYFLGEKLGHEWYSWVWGEYGEGWIKPLAKVYEGYPQADRAGSHFRDAISCCTNTCIDDFGDAIVGAIFGNISTQKRCSTNCAHRWCHAHR